MGHFLHLPLTADPKPKHPAAAASLRPARHHLSGFSWDAPARSRVLFPILLIPKPRSKLRTQRAEAENEAAKWMQA